MLEEMFYGNDMIIDALGDSIFSNLDCLFHHQLRCAGAVGWCCVRQRRGGWA